MKLSIKWLVIKQKSTFFRKCPPSIIKMKKSETTMRAKKCAVRVRTTWWLSVWKWKVIGICTAFHAATATANVSCRWWCVERTNKIDIYLTGWLADYLCTAAAISTTPMERRKTKTPTSTTSPACNNNNNKKQNCAEKMVRLLLSEVNSGRYRWWRDDVENNIDNVNEMAAGSSDSSGRH